MLCALLKLNCWKALALTNTDEELGHVSFLIDKVCTIVKWVKNSVIVSDELCKLQLVVNVREGDLRKLILDVKTR